MPAKPPLSLKEAIRRIQLGVLAFAIVLVVVFYAGSSGIIPKDDFLPIVVIAFAIYFYFFWGWFSRLRAWYRLQNAGVSKSN